MHPAVHECQPGQRRAHAGMPTVHLGRGNQITVGAGNGRFEVGRFEVIAPGQPHERGDRQPAGDIACGVTTHPVGDGVQTSRAQGAVFVALAHQADIARRADREPQLLSPGHGPKR